MCICNKLFMNCKCVTRMLMGFFPFFFFWSLMCLLYFLCSWIFSHHLQIWWAYIAYDHGIINHMWQPLGDFFSVFCGMLFLTNPSPNKSNLVKLLNAEKHLLASHQTKQVKIKMVQQSLFFFPWKIISNKPLKLDISYWWDCVVKM